MAFQCRWLFRGLLAAFLVAQTAVAMPVNERYYELGPAFMYRNMGFSGEGGPMQAVGIHLIERNGPFGKMIYYFISQLALALGQAVVESNGKYVGSTEGVGYRVDYYRSYSSQERADMTASRESAGKSVLASEFTLDVQIYLPGILGMKAGGYRVEFVPGQLATQFDNGLGLYAEIGFSYMRLGDSAGVMPDTGMKRDRVYETLGIPIRGGLTSRFIDFALQWEPNIFGGLFDLKAGTKRHEESLGQTNTPLLYSNNTVSAILTLNPFDRFFIRGMAHWEQLRFTLDAFSFQGEAGVRF